MDSSKPRLIEHAFPLKQASLTSVHEKAARFGHISALHLWPARRPLAACRAALLATLLPDPGTTKERHELCERIGGKVVEKIERKKMPDGKIAEIMKEEVEGGILKWIGTAPSSSNKKARKAHQDIIDFREKELQWFRDEIRKTYGGRAPRVLDPFAGGGAIPLEAMRLGCEATAVDINPVAWFILKCTLEYPQKLAGKTHPLPDFILEDEAFMEDFYKVHPHLVGRTKKTKKQLEEEYRQPTFWDTPDSGRAPKADLAWHVRAWGRWVLKQARKELAPFYPTYADFEPIDLKNPKPYERLEMRLVPLKDDGTPNIDALNAEFSEKYLSDKRNPRWVAKPTVAYLWARTVTCKNCRATVPLLKTKWLSRKKSGRRQRILLIVEPNATRDSVCFKIQDEVPLSGKNAAQRREHDKQIGQGTMSRSGAKCPCCGTIMTMEDLQQEGKSERLKMMLTAVATEDVGAKRFRLPTTEEITAVSQAEQQHHQPFTAIPFGMPNEHLVEDAKRNTWCVQYGLDRFSKLFTKRQLLALGTILNYARRSRTLVEDLSYAKEWKEAIAAYLSCALSRLVDFLNCGAQWKVDVASINHLFVRYALPVSWDFAEGNATGTGAGSYALCLERIASSLDSLLSSTSPSPSPQTVRASSTNFTTADEVDLVMTDPPYYNAIGYAVLMDYFYVWLRRSMWDFSPDFGHAFQTELCPKWDDQTGDIELVDDASRHGGDANASKAAYEQGMAKVFSQCARVLHNEGRMVIVFAHKDPDAWETLAGAIIQAGFIVCGSWPIQTEQASRMRAQSSSALATSVWLVCRKRPVTARPGWDNRVLEEMRSNITEKLREYWDAGIRGPDFVWAATGPALEAYSQHPVVKKANDPGQIMTVGEFLGHVRRMVVDFVVGEVLSGDGTDRAAADRMDSVTAYYLLHRHDFEFAEAPAGACILYATACGISDRDLEATWDLITTKGGASAPVDDDSNESDESDDEDGEAESTSSGGMMKLKAWSQRKGRNMGYEAPSGQPIPLIDRVHRLMHLWRAGDVHNVDEYLDDNGLRRHELFCRLIQSLIELSERNSEERTLLESLSNHIGARGATKDDKQLRLI